MSCPYHKAKKDSTEKSEENQDNQTSTLPPGHPPTTSSSGGKCPVDHSKSEQKSSAGKCPVDHSQMAKSETSSGKCPVDHSKMTKEADSSQESSGKCPYIASQKEKESTPVVNPHADKLEQSEAEAVAAVETGDQDLINQKMRSHFKAAYEAVGERALANSTTKDKEKAVKMARKLGYTDDQIEVVGDDVVRMQGTGNPHKYAKLQPNEHVIDLGSGLGIDAFLAAHAVGEGGHVVGVEQSLPEICVALERTAARKLKCVDFRVGDIEQLPIASESINCVISNGGFCLVPDKRQAFREIARVLVSGGRCAISCTLRCVELNSDVKWPSCFHVFMNRDDVKDIVESAGLKDVVINYNDEVDEEVEFTENEKKQTTIHRGSETYKHLNNYDMDTMFKYVTITAHKE